MTPPDLTRVHHVILAWLLKSVESLPDPPQATPAEAAEAVPIERWALGRDRWGLLRIEGVLVTFDGFEFRFRVTPLAVNVPQRLVWTSHGWLRLGSLATQPEAEPLLGALEELQMWCDALREGLRHG